MPTFEEHVDAIESEHNTVTAERDALVAKATTLEQTGTHAAGWALNGR